MHKFQRGDRVRVKAAQDPCQYFPEDHTGTVVGVDDTDLVIVKGDAPETYNQHIQPSALEKL